MSADLYAREVAVQLDQWYDGADCDRVACALHKVLGALCTAEAAAARWI
ncbi:MAG: hypothetical protein ABSE73_21395 [Planctomycetota bacterium]